MDRTLTRYSLTLFESLDVEGPDGAAAARLKDALGQEIAARVEITAGWAGVDEVVAALASQGHRFELRKSTEEWHSYFQETNGGTREFWIHASREADLVMVMVLYHEKLEVTAARRLERLGPGERADAETTDAFYDEGLVLVRRDEAGERLTDDERLHLVLLSLENGARRVLAWRVRRLSLRYPAAGRILPLQFTIPGTGLVEAVGKDRQSRFALGRPVIPFLDRSKVRRADTQTSR